MALADAAATSPLGIRHLLLWVAGCAVTLGVYRLTSEGQELAPGDQAFAAAWQMANSMAYGAALAGLAIIGWRRLRGDRRLPCLPGHWLLVLGAVTAALDAGFTLGFLVLAEAKGVSFYVYWWHYGAAGYGCGAVVVAAALIGIRQPWRWRGPLVALFLVFATQCCLHLAILYAGQSSWVGSAYDSVTRWLGTPWGDRAKEHLMAAGAAAGVITLLIAWLCDRIARRRGDWIHYTGVAVWVVMGCTHLAAYVYYVWLPTLKPAIDQGEFPAYGF
jgi:hypothetical protein